MPISVNGKTVSDVYLGSQKLQSVYAGDKKVWPDSVTPQIIYEFQNASHTSVWEIRKQENGGAWVVHQTGSNTRNVWNALVESSHSGTYSTSYDSHVSLSGMTRGSGSYGFSRKIWS